MDAVETRFSKYNPVKLSFTEFIKSGRNIAPYVPALHRQVFPFALATILVPMAGGCAITYARVNLGFWWGVLLHTANNVPGVLVLLAMSSQ